MVRHLRFILINLPHNLDNRAAELNCDGGGACEEEHPEKNPAEVPISLARYDYYLMSLGKHEDMGDYFDEVIHLDFSLLWFGSYSGRLLSAPKSQKEKRLRRF